MALIDEAARRRDLPGDMGPATEISGGSAANTIVGLASFGARAAFVGKVKDDQIGELYSHDIRAANVAFETKAGIDRPRHRLLLYPGDAGWRAHHEHLSRRGAGSRRLPISMQAQIAAAAIVYLEGYLWDPQSAKEAFVKAANIAHERQPPGRADAVGCVLRRPLSR